MNPASLWLTITCLTFPMEITKEGAQSLRMKMPNAQLSLKEASYLRLYLLAARLPELTSKSERLDCSHLLNSEHTDEQAFNWLLVEWAMIRNCWGSIRWEDRSRRYYASERYYAACKCCSSIFAKIKLLIINRDSAMEFSVVVLLLKYNFCLRNIFSCLSSKNSLGWDFVFTTFFVRI